MDAIAIAAAHHHFTYASRGIVVTPNPPSVGEPTTISLCLNNPGPTPLTVEHIAVKVARFGMGLHWEVLPPLGPFILAPDPTHIATIDQQWTPSESGHSCVRAAIHIEGQAQPLTVGCNLHVIEATADQRIWQVPFRLGNPEPARAPLVLSLQTDESLRADIFARNHHVRVGEPIWLEPGEEIDALLALRTRTHAAIDALPTVEAYINGQLVDGIAVHLLRPAFALSRPENDAATRTRERVAVAL